MLKLQRKKTMNAKPNASSSPSSAFTDRRHDTRIQTGDIVNGTTVDPVLRSYLPFKAKVVDISETGIQLAVKIGKVTISEGTKVIIIPPAMKEISGSSKEAVVIWCKQQGNYTICGCMFTNK